MEAYLEGTADSWQEFIVEDYFDSFSFGLNILDLLCESEVQKVGKRLLAEITKIIGE